MRWFLGLILATATAHADPDWARCADEAIVGATETERDGFQIYLHGRPAANFDGWEQRYLGEPEPLRHLLLLALDANDLHDSKRVEHLAEVMEKLAAALPATTWTPDATGAEGLLAQVQVLAGHGARAREHLVAGEAIAARDKQPLFSVYPELWAAAIAMQDDAARARLQKAYLATESGRAELQYTAKNMTLEGAGWGVLAVADAVGGAIRQDTLDAMMAGIEERHDYALGVEVLSRLDPNKHLEDAAHLWGTDGDDDPKRVIVGAIKSAIAVASRADDVSRADLIYAAVNAGLAVDAESVAAKIANPWRRADSEAVIATGLALTDKRAAIALAHVALKRAKTKGWRTDVATDTEQISNTTYQASIALARAGALDEANQLESSIPTIDVMYGQRSDPKAVAAWWATASPATRAMMFAGAAKHTVELAAPSFLAPFCKH
jgi:hypothetical protein